MKTIFLYQNKLVKNFFPKRLLFISLLLITMDSCDLSENPYGQYSTEGFYTNVKRLDLAVLNVYASLQTRASHGEVLFTAFDNGTDLSHFLGAGASTGARGIAHYTIDANFSEIESFWRVCYTGINTANDVLANIDKVPTANPNDIATKAKLEAEVKFLRAIYYFNLVRYFGDVPLKLGSSVLGDDFQMPRTPKADVYAQIVKDLEESIPDLPWNDQVTVSERATKNAAMGMLARVQLFRGGYSLDQDGIRRRPDNYKEYYNEVLKWTDELIKSGKNRLNPNYEQIFINQCKYLLDPKENLFEIDLVAIQGVLTNGFVGTSNGLTTVAGVYARVAPWTRTHGFAYSKFETEDLRRDISIATYSLNSSGVRVPIPADKSYDWTAGKWSRIYQTDDQFKNLTMTNINFVVLRYSDVLLMRAEALNEINGGSTAEANELVNQVRRRGYGKPIIAPNVTVDMPVGLNKQQFLSYIQDERARELMFEGGIRRLDLIRWNILGDKLKEVIDFQTKNPKLLGKYNFSAPQFFTQNQHELYPIPLRELRENKKLIQNPGYNY
ncbi:RagB/SusD family nutrient uptake outer membrane protein [Arcicella rosea]|uniref:Starch-binding associating with outer membrane n=1 Tax=Arcicella rosea TaxID=502909 RepID=A0A841EM92_9BACT|nr:RagB/SusD family nutrient uptake outer membrane protein [Arcicella rosea]MBB6002539.1 hypothetical protein [Arcicella rosea]